MTEHDDLTAYGQPGDSESAGPEWQGWSGSLAHPSAPMGGGGPGHFSRMPMGAGEQSDSPWTPGPIGVEQLDDSKPKPANPPPATTAGSLGVVKEVTGDHYNYKIEAEILDDGSMSSGTARTVFSEPASSAPGWNGDSKGMITKFNGKFTFTGVVQIQTQYAASSGPELPSCYGRGTTDADVTSRDISLGFHESCHRADYQNFLKNNALPDPPKMEIGMKGADYDAAVATFKAALLKYWKDMKAESIKVTDEVGYTKTKWQQTNVCFQHKTP